MRFSPNKGEIMTDSQWLTYESQRTGKPIDQIRREMGEKAKRTKPENKSFAKHPELAKKAVAERWRRYYEKNPEKKKP